MTLSIKALLASAFTIAALLNYRFLQVLKAEVETRIRAFPSIQRLRTPPLLSSSMTRL
jgi:hypothetical protein